MSNNFWSSQITPLPYVLKAVMDSIQAILFPIYKAKTVNAQFWAPTQNGQLQDHGEQFAKFDKKIYWITIAHCTFNYHQRNA